MSIHTTDERAAAVAGLRELADFLEANPALPVPTCMRLSPSVPGSDDEQRAEVDRVAAILDRAPETVAGGDHYQVLRDFGPVVYQAVAITHAHMERWDALMTYGDAVLPAGSAQ